MSQIDKNSEIDEAIWNAWLEKNKSQDRFSLGGHPKPAMYGHLKTGHMKAA